MNSSFPIFMVGVTVLLQLISNHVCPADRLIAAEKSQEDSLPIQQHSYRPISTKDLLIISFQMFSPSDGFVDCDYVGEGLHDISGVL